MSPGSGDPASCNPGTDPIGISTIEGMQLVDVVLSTFQAGVQPQPDKVAPS